MCLDVLSLVMSLECLVFLCESVFVFKLPDGFHYFISSISKSKSSLLSGSSCCGSKGVDLTDSEPGKGGEHKVEQVLSDMDHDVLILKDSFLDNFTTKIIMI